MRIIKDGVIKPKTIVFECDECGCIFEAEKDEYSYSSQMEVMHDGLGGNKCKCPCCNNMVYTKNRM